MAAGELSVVMHGPISATPTKRSRVAPLGLLSAVVALGAWLLVAPRTPDLAAAA